MNAPKRWKTIAVNFAVVFPALQFCTRFITPVLNGLPGVLREAVMVLFMCILLSVAVPAANKHLAAWLQR